MEYFAVMTMPVLIGMKPKRGHFVSARSEKRFTPSTKYNTDPISLPVNLPDKQKNVDFSRAVETLQTKQSLESSLPVLINFSEVVIDIPQGIGDWNHTCFRK